MKDKMSTDFGRLARAIEGDILTDELSRNMLATDASIFCVPPAAVAFPRTTHDVVHIVRFAARQGLSIHPRGAGSGLCGSALGTGVVVDFSRYMHRLLSVDVDRHRAECQPGCRLGELETALEGSGLFFPPDPSSSAYATFGGMFNTNASGSHSVKYGNTADYVLDADIVLTSGRVVHLSALKDTPQRDLPANLQALYHLYETHAAAIENAYPDLGTNVCGYNLRSLVQDGRLDLTGLIAGSEGTLGLVTRLALQLRPRPVADSLIVAAFDHIVPAAKAVQMTLPLKPSGIEMIDKSLLRLATATEPGLRGKIPTDIDNLLLIEFDGARCADQAQQARDMLLADGLCRQAHMAVSDREKAGLWAVRRAAVPTLYRLKGARKIVAIIEDAAVPTERLVEYFRGLYRLLNHHRVDFVIYGHIAKGLLHTRPLLDLKNPGDVDLLKPLADGLFELVHSLDGTVSGEHGDGRLRSTYIKKLYPDIYPLFLQARRLMDPEGLLNPEIKISRNPQQMQTSLRFGTGYRSREPWPIRLRWNGSFTREVESCHGCARCTTPTTATRMCPIYKFTRREEATPRAKANLLRALISGAITDKTLYTRAFQQIMANCVNCASCRTECPTRVDIPRMVTEARARYVTRFGTSFEDQLLTSLEPAARVNRHTRGGLSMLMGLAATRRSTQWLTGVSAQRSRIAFARPGLDDRIAAVQGGGEPKVLYFAGCYARFIRPEIGAATVAVLIAMGMRVHFPQQHCCGLPMLSKGMARAAQKKVADNLAAWQPLLSKVDHIVVTCSSCGLSLLEEWRWLLPEQQAARIAEKTVHISRLINRYRDRLQLREHPARVKVAYHMPCHLKVQPEASSSIDLLSALPGVSLQVLDSHCCGMAGSWGLSARHADLSIEIGRDLMARLDASRAAAAVTDCPTCRLQIEQLGHLPVHHPVELVARSLKTADTHGTPDPGDACNPDSS